MKSKISFFNKTIFWKNITLYWPIWAVYTAILIFVQPVVFGVNCQSAQYGGAYSYDNCLSDFISVLQLDFYVFAVMIMALFTGMAMFHYLYSHKSASMIHAFPVDRTQLYGTNIISGITFLAVPQVLSAFLTVIIALCYGIKEIHYAGIWLLLMFGVDIVLFAIVTFCAMITGHILALPVYVIIINNFSYGVYALVDAAVGMFGLGVSGLGSGARDIAILFNSVDNLMTEVGLFIEYNEITGECIGAQLLGVGILLVYLLVAIVLYAAAYVIYQKRHIEQAGEFITVGWIRPIFRFGIGFTGGLLGSIMMRELLMALGFGCKLPLFILILLVIGALAYFASDMLLNKSFRVFKKKNWVGCGIFSVALLIGFFGLYHLAKYYEDYQPKMEEIASASVSMGYQIEMEGEDIAVVMEIHDEILENKEICIAAEESGNLDLTYLNIRYVLKNGDSVFRDYLLPAGYEEIDNILEKVAVMEQDIDNYLTYVFGKEYEQVKTFSDGWLEAQFYNRGYTDGDGNADYTFDSVNITSEQAKELYEAILADARAGTLMKYNVHTQWVREGSTEESWKYSEASIILEFREPNGQYGTQMVMDENSVSIMGVGNTQIVEYENWSSSHITFGPDCENIVNKLIEFGFIESVDDIWWGELPD